MPWRVTVRSGPTVERLAADSLHAALVLVEKRARTLAAGTRVAPVELRVKSYAPAQQVAHRIEIAGPRRFLAPVRAGVDVRGDGSLQAFTGRTARRPLDGEGRKEVFDALRRAVGA